MKCSTIPKLLASGVMASALLLAMPFSHAAIEDQTPDQAIKSLVEAAHKGDTDGFLSGLTSESRNTVVESYAHRAAMHHQLEEFQNALDERFGKGAVIVTPAPSDLRTAIGRVENAVVISQSPRTDGSVELRVKTTYKTENGQAASREDKLIMRQEADAWKLSLGSLGYVDGKTADERTAATERVTKEVRDGKYKNRISAIFALGKAWAIKERTKP